MGRHLRKGTRIRDHKKVRTLSPCSILKDGLFSLDVIEGNKWQSIKGDQSRAPRTPYAYQFNNIDNALQFPIEFANDVLNWTDGSNVVHSTTIDGTGKALSLLDDKVRYYEVIHLGVTYSFYCEEESGNISYSSRQFNNLPFEVIIEGANIHSEDKLKDISKSNDVGFTLSGSIIIPIDESTGLDVLGNTPTYTGEVAYNAKLGNFQATEFNIIDNEIDLGITGLTITSYISEAGTTPIIDGQFLKVDVAGWLAKVVLSNGETLIFLGYQNVYAVNSNTLYTISGASVSIAYQNVYDYLGMYGFSLPKPIPYNTTTFIEPEHISEFYVRPLGGSYGLEDGTSFENAFNGFSGINWRSIGVNDLLYVCGTHNERLVVENSNVIIKDFDNSLIDINNLGNTGLEVDSKTGVYLIGLSVTNAIVSNFNIIGSSEIIGSDLTATDSGNQNYQHLGTAKATYYNIVGNDGADDGVSQHDATEVIVYGGVFNGNDQGINLISESKFTGYNITTLNNASFDIYVTQAASDKSCIANIYNLKSNGHSACNRLAVMNIYYGEVSSIIADQVIEYGDGAISTKGYGEIHYCVIKNIPFGKYGVLVNQYSEVNVYNSVFDSGISANGGMVTFANSIVNSINNIYQNLVRGIYVAGGTTTTTSNSDLFFNCSSENIGGVATVINDITADPLLNADYTPTALSPTIANGAVGSIENVMVSSIFGTTINVVNKDYLGGYDRGAFSYVSNVKTSSSRLNIGQDVLGGTLTNPPVLNTSSQVVGLNNSEALLTQYEAPRLIQNDPLNYFFDALGNAKALTYEEIVNNPYVRVNTLNPNAKIQLTMWDHNLTPEEIAKVDKCFIKENELPEGMQWVVNELGQYVISENGQYQYEPIP